MARPLGVRLGPAFCPEFLIDFLPDLRVDDGRVLSVEGFAFVFDLPDVDGVG